MEHFGAFYALFVASEDLIVTEKWTKKQQKMCLRATYVLYSH